jgi:hypothetical protein
MNKRRIGLFVAAALPCVAVLADEPDAAANYRLHINGITFHFDKGKDTNELGQPAADRRLALTPKP